MLDLEELLSVIATEEGFWRDGTPDIPQTHNNPGDLRNYTPPYKIADFPTIADGIAWGITQLALDVRRGQSLRQLVYNWAPPSENNSEAYFQFVASKFPQFDPDTPLKNYYEIRKAE